MRRFLIAVPLMLLVLLACTRAEKAPPSDPPVRRDPVATDAGPAAATVKPASGARDVSTWVSDWPKTWTDPRVVAALAEDCSFVPARPRKPGPPEISGSSPGDIFTCRLAYEQSCNPDACTIPSSACERACAGTCDDCGGACVGSCTACKSACKDDSCKRACATKCGECKQTCTRTMDRCATGDCAKAHEACNVRLRAMWTRSNCTARCAGHSKCQAKCANDGSEASMACTGRCDDKVSPGFGACTAKCDELRMNADASDSYAPEACLMKCYETVPCAPFLCQTFSPLPNER